MGVCQNTITEGKIRNELKALYKTGKHKFRATMSKYKKKKKLKMLLLNVSCDGIIVTDHSWIVNQKAFSIVNDGDVIEFEAVVDVYVKGYFGRNRKAVGNKKIEIDYQLINVDNIVILPQKGGSMI